LLLGCWGLSVFAREKLILSEWTAGTRIGLLEGLRPLDKIIGTSNEWGHVFDLCSDIGQGSMAVLAIFSPFLIKGEINRHRKLPTPWLLRTIRLFRAAAINGVLLEWVRIGVQRPRPYLTAKLQTGNTALAVSDFTSFYSGHTSFSFAALATLAFALRESLSQDPNPKPQDMRVAIMILLLAVTTASATGLMRVLAGRHHLSDVIAGATMGVISGLLAARVNHRARTD